MSNDDAATATIPAPPPLAASHPSTSAHLTLGARSGLAIVVLYTATMFLSAGLLFLVQPMFARMVLPRMGGSPAVWNTAVVFYQCVLLSGYIYAHATTRWLTIRQQIVLHAVVVLLPLLVLPIAVPSDWEPPTSGTPIWALLGLLGLAVGLPFFVVSTTSPLLQAWFSRTGHPNAGDPYFLYAASNVGSLLGLLSYPFWLEPRLRLTEQSWVWTSGYIALLALVLASAAVVYRRHTAATTVEANEDAAPPEQLTVRRRVRWVLLAAVPSSLMLSVTTYLATAIAPLPLLWAIPLSLYLLTFILVFAQRQFIPQWLLRRALPILVLPLLLLTVPSFGLPAILLMPLHLVVFFLAAMVCHGALAEGRPASGHLTEFYLWMSFGGALGGAFTALLAPALFASIQEYPLTLAALCAIAPVGGAATFARLTARRYDVLLPAALAALTAALLAVVVPSDDTRAWATIFGIALLACFIFSRMPIRYGLSVASIVVAGLVFPLGDSDRLHVERNFFGVKEVRMTDDGRLIQLVHGGVGHGAQSTDPALRSEPLTYYARGGPLGQVVEMLHARDGTHTVGALGLGAGSAACYARPGESWTFYEIDPQVVSIARNPRYFTYLADCTPSAPIVLGDARLSLRDAPNGGYGLLILDAYSGDAIPVHLLTREAIDLYLDKLAPEGVMAFHISNLYFDLQPVLGRLADEAGIVAAVREDLALSTQEADIGKSASVWVTMARSPEDLGSLLEDPRWHRLDGKYGGRVWTDDYSSLLDALIWP